MKKTRLSNSTKSMPIIDDTKNYIDKDWLKFLKTKTGKKVLKAMVSEINNRKNPHEDFKPIDPRQFDDPMTI